MKKYQSILLMTTVLFLYAGLANAIPYTGADIILSGTEFSGISHLGNSPRSGGNEWYKEGHSIWTAWSKQWVEYKVELGEGNWNIGLNVKNHGYLGEDWYSKFKVSTNFPGHNILIDASDEEVNNGYTNIDIATAGIYTFRYTWLNDKWDPRLFPIHDANLLIDSAFFDNTATAPVPEPATMLLLGTGLLGIAGIRRSRQRGGE